MGKTSASFLYDLWYSTNEVKDMLFQPFVFDKMNIRLRKSMMLTEGDAADCRVSLRKTIIISV